jgi:hypothetical protein
MIVRHTQMYRSRRAYKRVFTISFKYKSNFSCETKRDFVCRSADYRVNDRTCTLTEQDMQTTPVLNIRDSDHYERRCVPRRSSLVYLSIIMHQ